MRMFAIALVACACFFLVEETKACNPLGTVGAFQLQTVPVFPTVNASVFFQTNNAALLATPVVGLGNSININQQNFGRRGLAERRGERRGRGREGNNVQIGR